jgi:type II secretory pathway component PulK
MIRNNQKGFIALISVVIISFVLLLVATTLSTKGFYARFNILDSESKERSNALADACIETARLKLANDTSYTADNVKIIVTTNQKCEYDANTGGSKIIIAHGCVNNAHTYYSATVNTTDPSIPITAFRELPTSGAFAFSCNI